MEKTNCLADSHPSIRRPNQLLLEQEEVIIRHGVTINRFTEEYTYVDILGSPMKGRTQNSTGSVGLAGFYLRFTVISIHYIHQDNFHFSLMKFTPAAICTSKSAPL
jgi:hypothetical protein